VSEEAPYGKTRDGRVKTSRRGRPRKDQTGPAGPSPRAKRPPSSSNTRSRKTDYTAGLTGILHMVAMPLLPTLPNDAAAILISADEVAEAINTTAQERPEIRAMCEKIMTVGPYGLMIAAILKPVTQIAVNHGLIPPQMASKFGAVPPEHLSTLLAQKFGQPIPEQAPAPQHTSNGYHHHAAPVG